MKRWILVAAVLLAAILIPFAIYEDEMNQFAARLLAPENELARATLAIAIAALLASDVLLPVPSSIASTAAGALFGWPLGATISWAGMTIGCAIAWAIGRSAGRAGLSRWVGESELARAAKLAEKYGVAAVVVARPIPVLAEATALLAGAIGVPGRSFLAAAALANLGISLAYAIAGATAADSSSSGSGLGPAFAFLFAFAGAILLPGIAILLGRLMISK